jgi:hypothetical protein
LGEEILIKKENKTYDYTAIVTSTTAKVMIMVEG